MKTSFKTIAGSVVAPQGFLAAGVYCGVQGLSTGKGSQKGQKPDVALILSEMPCAVAGMFTTNQIAAAPVKVCIPRVARGVARAVVANSGNANACTGKQGRQDATEMAALVAREFKIPANQVLVASTGRIGLPLPMERVRTGIHRAATSLGSTVADATFAAEAILTSDTHAKQIAVAFELGGKTVRLGGICKGAGMIQPGMSASGRRPAARPLHATMLCFLTTDADVEPRALQAALQEAVAQSFNCITVDGDMSTNDTVLLMANGLAENPRLKSGYNVLRRVPDFQVFQDALNHVCLELAKMIVRDGEGVTRFVTVRVNGARNFHDADAAARAVANSALVKTSWFGGDPNWGRIIDALGYSSAEVVEGKVDIGYSTPGSSKVLWSLKRGQPTKVTFKQLCKAVAAKEFDLHVNLNLGRSSAYIYAADLTEEYVGFNKGDISAPAALGG